MFSNIIFFIFYYYKKTFNSKFVQLKHVRIKMIIIIILKLDSRINPK
jgi:hypothetical protein